MGSGPLPREGSFLVPNGRGPKYFRDSFVSNQIIRLCFPSSALAEYEVCTVKTTDNKDYVKLKERRSIISFNEDYDKVAPHFYIYSYQPRLESQEPDERTEDQKALYVWARLSIESPRGCCTSGSAPIFTMRMACKCKVQNYHEMFAASSNPETYKSALHGENELSVKKGNRGACLISGISEGTFSFECEGCYCATVAPGGDPILMICYAICVDFCRA